MIKTFDELLERAKAKNVVVHTPTETQAISLLKELDKNGYTWCGGDKLTTTHYGSYKENTCYDFSFDTDGILVFKKVMFGTLIFYQDQGYTIIELTDIDFSEKPTKTTPKSDIKVIYQSKDKLTTCVVFEDGTKVKVKKHKGEKTSLYTAVAYAITKKTYGSNKVFTEIVDKKLYKGRK